MSNDTTQTERDELVERVRMLANWDENEGLILQGETIADTEMIEDPAAEIIRVVRRAAWKEFEAAMLSEEVVKAGGHGARRVLVRALSAIAPEEASHE